MVIRSRLIRWTLVPVLAVMGTDRVSGAADAALPDGITAAWEKAATFFPDEAATGFEKAGGNLEDGPREARLGYAVALLSANPSTRERLDLAQSIFESLAGSGHDEYGLAAGYLLGRLHQIYRSPTEPEMAESRFRRLIEAQPESRWAQMSLVKLGILIVYSLPDAGTPDERVEAARALLPRAVSADARRDLNLLIASAHFHYELEPTGALSHLIAAEEGGGLDIGSRADILVRIAELLVLSGQPESAVNYYRRFVREYYGDERRFAVQKKIEGITGEEEASE